MRVAVHGFHSIGLHEQFPHLDIVSSPAPMVRMKRTARISHFAIVRLPAHMVRMTLRANVRKSMLPRCPRQDRVARMRAITSGLRSNANKAHAIEPLRSTWHLNHMHRQPNKDLKMKTAGRISCRLQKFNMRLTSRMPYHHYQEPQ